MQTTRTSGRRRVMHLIDTGGPGGAETVFSQLVLRTPNYEPIAVVPREGWLSAQLRNGGVEPRVINAKGSLNVGYLRQLMRIVREEGIELIHAHLLGSCTYAALLGLTQNVPVIGVFHGPTDLKHPGKFASIKKWLVTSKCSRIVAVSDSTRAAMIEFGISPQAITSIPNGVDTRAFTPGRSTQLRSELKLSEAAILIGAVGNIRAPKAYDVLLQAAQIVLAENPNVHFAVVGQGEKAALDPLLQLREALGIGERFHFLGFRKTDADLFRNFDMFVSSSRSEGLPLSFLEAMASGLCVVATRSGGAQEVIETDHSGLLVPIEDPPALAAALLRAAGDSELRSRLAQIGRERVLRDFSLDVTLAQYGQLYGELLAN